MFRFAAFVLLVLFSAAARAEAIAYRPVANEGDLVWMAGRDTLVAFGKTAKGATRRWLSGRFACEAETFGAPDGSGRRCFLPEGAILGYQVLPAFQLEDADPEGSLVAACVPGLISTAVNCRGVRVGTFCNGQKESQAPVFMLAPGAELHDVVITKDAANGVWGLGSSVVDGVIWENTCEDAATMRGPGVMEIRNSSVSKCADKCFQHNGIAHPKTGEPSRMWIHDVTLRGAALSFYRSCGERCEERGGRELLMERVTVTGTIYRELAGVNNPDHATIREVRVRKYNAYKPPVCNEYDSRGLVLTGSHWNGTTCDVSHADVTSF